MITEREPTAGMRTLTFDGAQEMILTHYDADSEGREAVTYVEASEGADYYDPVRKEYMPIATCVQLDLEKVTALRDWLNKIIG